MVETGTFLGPARVTEVVGSSLRLAFEDRKVEAVLAVSYPYRPVVGDIVLAIGQDEAFYAIGVIQGNGTTEFVAPGPIVFHAPRGPIELLSTEGIRLRSREVEIHSERLEVNSRSILERCVDAFRWIRNAFQLRAGRVQEVVDGKYSLSAERISERADRDVKIDGEKIHLG